MPLGINIFSISNRNCLSLLRSCILR
ncbi:Protein of unknown function [Pyronema omphalodes CBS 100304]|uniref:Uncharacterized protein n=1 Tax=Pyronema omphalodes (strain CBS 100304) TaxID=1076935 RepID=U4L7Z9_PYROM|nr:Protein of unknown function [Pyronema omphalodes CBS 100304]